MDGKGSKIAIVGAGGFGREAADVAAAMVTAAGESIWRIVGVFDDHPSEENLARLEARGVSYLGPLPTESDSHGLNYVVGIGSPATRRAVDRKCTRLGWTPATLVHPRASLRSWSTPTPGTIICAGAVISTNVRFGKHVHVNPNATIGHDAIINDYCSINPNATISGEVKLSDESLVGAGATVLQGLRVGRSAVVGAMACVTRDVPDFDVVKGVPAR